MSNKKKISAYLMALGVAGASALAFSENDNTGWFVGGTIASAKADFSEGYFTNDENSFLLSPYWGYNFSNTFGLESQFYLGEYGDFDLAILSITPRVNFDVAPNVSLFLRGGLSTTVLVDEDDDDEALGGIIPTLGFGARFDLDNNIRLSVAYDYSSGELEYDEDSVMDGVEVDIDQGIANLSLYYQF